MNDISGAARGPRVEDERLVRGLGRFMEDAKPHNAAYAVFVRSPHAFGRIVSVATDEARRAPGVLAVLTAADMAGVGNVSRHPPMTGRNGAKLVQTNRPALATERVLHIGQPVAAVIATTHTQAQDAAELVAVEYEPLDPVTDVREAVRPGAPQLWPEAPGNVALDWPGPVADEGGAKARAVEEAIAGAAHVARVTAVNQRIMVASMEPRGASASYDPANDHYTLRACSQGAGPLRDALLPVMGLRREQLRVVTDDVGGAFGMKSSTYPEYPVLLVAAKRVGRVVHWMATRQESFLSDNQARDTVTEAELALDAQGNFLALRIRHLAGVGGFLGSLGAHIQTNNFSRCFPGMYDIRRVAVEVRCVFTNTVPLGPYRGAGRPEANYVLERVVDEAARITGIDRVKLRRRNLIRRSQIPYKTAVGTVYDSGDFPPIFEQALQLSDHAGFKARRREAAKRKKYRGYGISCFLEHSGGAPTEGASLRFADRSLTLGLGVQSTGQGHATVFPRLAAQRLGIAPERIRHQHGDTDLDITGFPSVASRSAMMVSHAVVNATDKMLEKGRKVAATLLEAAEADITYRDGAFEVVGTDRRMSLFDVAEKAAEMAAQGRIPESLDTKVSLDTPQAFPNGCHIAEVEVDPATGQVALVSYVAVDDCGTVLDPVIVHGQIHGGLAQGLGQALFEQAVYDSGGQLMTGSFMDYAMPRAEDMPEIRDDNHPVPATTNPLGVKGVGEAGTIGSLAAIMNAVADAIPGGAGARIEMPATAEKVWRACQEAGQKA